MTGGSRIVSIGSGQEQIEEEAAAEAPDEALSLQEEWMEYDYPEAESRPQRDWPLPAAAALLIVAWTGFFGWVHQDAMLAGASPLQWSEWISQWAVPVLLVIALWLLVMRNSLRESRRFNDAAQALSRESQMLEERLLVVNRELSLAREFIASQSRDLEALGRVASERISQHAERLSGMIIENSEQIESIATVSTNALDNMTKLRSELPVIANSARDVTNQIGNAGRSAQGQLQELVSGFHRLNEFGEASERQVQSLKAQVDLALAAFEAQAVKLDEIASSRFAALTEKSEEYRSRLDSHEVETLAAIRRRADQLGQELAATREELANDEDRALETLRNRLTTLNDHSATLTQEIRDSENKALETWGSAVETLEAQLAEAIARIEQIDSDTREAADARRAAWDHNLANWREQVENWSNEQIIQADDQLMRLDAAITERRDAHLASSREFAQHVEALTTRLGDLAVQTETIAARGGCVQEELSSALATLSDHLSASRDALTGTDTMIATLTDSSIRLLEIIQAGAQHSRDDLSSAVSEAENRLTGVTSGIEQLGLMITEANGKGRELSEYVTTAQRYGAEAMQEVERFHTALSAKDEQQSHRIKELRAELAALGAESEQLASVREQHLRSTLDALTEASRSMITELENNSAEAVTKLAASIGENSAEAIDRAVKTQAADAIQELEQAAAQASTASREAALQLRNQLAKVAELTSNLESRVAYARRRAEEQVDNDFARRVTLITEALNSNAIDISKALSNDVTDTAWASYLRGDRGVFTRRAVKLLDGSESRAVLEVYENDRDFHEHVNRFIHDFEAMLRQLLSTRDGHAISVTLLSSDMGKLYVALAQAIERLRG